MRSLNQPCTGGPGYSAKKSGQAGKSELPSFLEREELQFIFFGGKGGVGKTTAAAASALYLARQRLEDRILIVSTDPAHSLGDSFEQPVGGEVVPVEGVDNLFALELDAEKIVVEWHRECDPMIAKIMDRGTYFDGEDIEDFLQLAMPGVDEAMAIMEIIHLAKDRNYDLVVVDTAPTGHTLRLLALPTHMNIWIKVMDRTLEKYRFKVISFVSRYVPDEVDRWLIKMAVDINEAVSLLKNTKITEFVPMTIPEEMVICETERMVSALKEQPMVVKNLIVNQVVDNHGDCSTCRQREESQAGSLAEIKEKFAGLRLLKVPLLRHEVRGIERLTEFGQLIMGDTREDKGTRGQGEKGISPPLIVSPSPPRPTGLSLPSARFILIGGKGGVGKTTVATATALNLASQFPEKSILVFSTDPAHSVGDSFGQAVGDKITLIEPYENVYAYEIDADRLLEDLRAEHDVGRDATFEQDMANQMLDLIPPGLDEMMALIEIMGLAEDEAFDSIILDTAPTGHLIRFLEMPELAHDWFRAAARMLLKYKETVKIGVTGRLVAKYSRQVRKLRQQLVNSDETEFIAITIPEGMAVAESERLLRSISGLNIPCRQMLVNKVTQPSDCSFCAAKRKEEQGSIQQLAAERPDLRLAQTPQLPHEIRGIDDLVEFGKILYGRSDIHDQWPRTKVSLGFGHWGVSH